MIEYNQTSVDLHKVHILYIYIINVLITNISIQAILAQTILAQGALPLLPLTRAGHTSYGRSCPAGGEDQSARCAAGRFPVDTPGNRGQFRRTRRNPTAIHPYPPAPSRHPRSGGPTPDHRST